MSFVHYRIKDLPQHERPRERLETFGPGALSNAELLAIILKTGTQRETAIQLASTLLSRFGSLKKLSDASVKELSEVHGIGIAKASQILAALELARRVATQRDGERLKVGGPEDLARIVGPELQRLNKEVLRVALLNSKNELIRIAQVAEGSLNTAAVRPRETFLDAIRECAAAVVLIHNHPTGDPEPSEADIKLTRDFADAGRLLDIELIDHLIIGDGGSYTSLRARGVIQ